MNRSRTSGRLLSGLAKLGLLSFFMIASACAKKEATSSQMKIALPSSEQLAAADMNFSKTDRQQALSAMSASTIWGQSTPVSLAGMKCFAVLISAADGLNDVSCTRLDGSEVFKSKHMAGLAPAGGVLSLEVPSGKAREIIVVGFGATDLGACMTVEDELPNLSLSAPMILARKTVDLPAGSVDVDLAATYNASQVFETCSSLELPTATPTPVPTASMSLSTGANYTFADTSVGAVSTHLVTVTNSGIAPATGINVLGLAAPFGFAGGSYPGSSGTCGTTLAAGSSCSLQIAFSPSTSGTQNDTLDFNYHDGVQTQTVALALEATALDVAVLSLNGGSGYNFGNITIGANASYTFTVVNSGGSTATLTPPTVTGMFTYTGGAYPGTAGTCAGTLSAGASCSIQVNFAPISGGGQSFTYTMNYDDGAGAQSASVTLSGTGVSPAVLTLSDGPTYVFSATAVGASLDHTFTLSNSGGSTATTITGSGLAAPFTFKGGSFPGTGGTCAATLAAAANCTIVVNFAPSITGLATDTLVVNFNDGATPQMVSGDVQGDGLSVASLSFDLSPTVNFPNATAGASSSMTVVVTNTGQSMASSIAASGVTLPFEFSGGVYPGVGGTCATTLAGGANCTMVLVFGPVSATTSNATLSLGYNNGAAAVNSTLGLTGTGLSPAVISISNGPTFNFGSVAQGGYFDWPLTLTNTGNSTATITADSGGLASPFTYAGGGGYPGVGGTCTSTLAPAANCTVVLRFAPSVSGSYTDTLEISYNNGAIGSSATRDLSGTGVIQASLSISDGPTYNFGSRNVNTSVNHTFTINNTGGYSASSMTGSIGGDFTFVGGSYPGTGGTCGATLGMGSSCTIVVRFLPMTVTSHSETITINYHNGASNQAATRPVQGLGTNPSFDQTNSFVTVSNSTLASGSSATVSFFARDNQGDPYVVPGTVVFSNFGGTSTVNIGPVTDQGGGEYTATISGQVAGTITTLSATFNSMSISSSLPTLTVIPGPVSEVTSTVSVSSSVINVSELVTVMLQARDAQGNLRTSGGDVVVFGTTGGTSTVSFGSVTDNGDGTYTASMTGSSAGTATTLTATINGLSVTTTMPTVTVNP